MAANMALKRAKKAQRRKQIVAQKRAAEVLESGLDARVARAARLSIQHCLLTEALFESGMGTLVLTRGVSASHVVLGAFLLDTFCLGVKDIVFRPVAGDELDFYLDRIGASSPLVPVDPSYARKLVRDLVAWSASLGVRPHRDFVAVERMFGDVDADACNVTFQFGHEGKPLYIPGPNDAAPVRRLLG